MYSPEHLRTRERRVKEEADLHVSDEAGPVGAVDARRRGRIRLAGGRRSECQTLKHGVDVLSSVLSHRSRVPPEKVAEEDGHQAQVVVCAPSLYEYTPISRIAVPLRPQLSTHLEPRRCRPNGPLFESLRQRAGWLGGRPASPSRRTGSRPGDLWGWGTGTSVPVQKESKGRLNTCSGRTATGSSSRSRCNTARRLLPRGRPGCRRTRSGASS